MASSNPGPIMTGETNAEHNVNKLAADMGNLNLPTEPSGESDGNRYNCLLSNMIGRGSYSTVFRSTFLDHQVVAIKRMQKIDAKIAEKEYKILMDASHENVIKNLQIDKDKNFIYLVLEFCHTNLNDMISTKVIKEYSIKVKLLHDIAFGLDHLHKKGIIHRDLKPSNILIKQSSVSKQIIPKIADFGIFRKLDVGRDHYTATEGGLGTRIWCAPEVLDKSNRRITTAIDMFAYGCIVHFVMCPASKLKYRHPFGTLTDDSGVDNIIKSIKAGSRSSYISTIVYQKPEAINKVKRLYSDILIQDLINVNPKNRPSIKHVLNFPLFWDVPQQLHFLTDQQKYLHEKQDQHFEDNCLKFFKHNRLFRMCVKPVYWETVAKQLTDIGLPRVPQTIPENNQMTNIFSHMLRVVRNKIVHYVEKRSNERIHIDLMLTNFHMQFPFFFPVLWSTYRYLQTPSRYSDKIDKVKVIIQKYYTPVDVADPDCLVTNLEFISKAPVTKKVGI